MKHFSLTFLILAYSLAGFSQTKLISHKSHSGNAENFKIALSSDDFNPKHSNFGEAPDMYVRNSQLDSVIYISEIEVVLVTSFFDEEAGNEKNSRSTWEPARETVYGHPLFSQQHSLDSIKMVLKHDFHFKNDIEKVIFIGYDNGEKTKEENEIYPTGTFPPKGNTPIYLIAILALAGFTLRVQNRRLIAVKI